MSPATDLRSGVSALSALASRDLQVIWRKVSTAVEARDALSDILPPLVERYGSAAATIAADWYDEQRDLVSAKGRFRAIPADVGPSGAQELARWGVGPLFAADPDWAAAKVLIEGGLQRRIANASRDTITRSAVQDLAAEGWQRAGIGECDFCRMLIGRGAVYSEATADFGAHDHCNCQAGPAFKGAPRPVKTYTISPNRGNEADRARAREWIAAHY